MERSWLRIEAAVYVAIGVFLTYTGGSQYETMGLAYALPYVIGGCGFHGVAAYRLIESSRLPWRKRP